MTQVDNKELVTRLYKDGWARGNLDVVDEVFAPEHVLHWNELTPTDQKRTTSEVKAIIQAYRNAFPDLKVEINAMIAEGDRVAVQITFIGTHERPYEGFRPTHQLSRFTDMQILRISGRKIVESSLPSGGLDYFYKILTGEAFREKPQEKV
jgi:predicted ester cyclase